MISGIECWVVVLFNFSFHFDHQFYVLPFANHKFLTEGPWKGSKGYMVDIKMKYLKLNNLFFKLSIWMVYGSVKTIV